MVLQRCTPAPSVEAARERPLWTDSGRPWNETSEGAAVVTGRGFSVHEKTQETVTMQREACHSKMCTQKLTAGEPANAAWRRQEGSPEGGL